MRISVLTIGAIASIIAINSVFADTTVTSRNYVDTQDALKQDKITAGTTGNVVTYNGTQNGQAQFSERGIFDPETDFDENDEVAEGHDGDLVTAGFIVPAVNQLYQQISGPANTVAMYNDAGFLGDSRGIYDGTEYYDEIDDADKLVTASVVRKNLHGAYNVTQRMCTEWVAGQAQTDANCLLWDLVPVNINYQICSTSADCANSRCCVSGICADCPA